MNKVLQILFFSIVGLLLGQAQLFGQVDSLPSLDSLRLATDSLMQDTTQLLVQDSLPNDSNRVSTSRISYSKDALDDQVEYDARDSIVYDIINKKIYLYGEASVKYTTLNLTADYIIFDWEKNEVIAEFTQDSTGQKQGIPSFQDGDQAFTANRMRYNFLTKKGIIYDVTSKYNDLYVLGTKAKFISKDADTLEVNDYIYSENAIFTTCDHPEPHYGIRSKKQKLVPGNVVVVGPSNLEIMGIPTPLWLPFGFFPVTEDRRQGLLFPRDYQYTQEWGFGLNNIGYYLPINDYMDLSATADIYFKGTYGLHLNSSYRKRYKYNGSFRIDFNDQRFENDSDASVSREKSLSIGWNHSQDRSAHPYNNLSGSVNIQTNGFQQRTQFDAGSQLNNTLNSSVRYQRLFPNQPLTFSANMAHSQNTRTNKMTITLPTTDFATQTLFPFKRKKRIGKEKWYEQITFRYKNQFRNQFETTDTTLFTQETLDNARYGMRHEASTGTSFKLSKYFSVNPNVSYNEVWYLKTLKKEFVEDLVVDTTIIYNIDSTDQELLFDTLSNGEIVEMMQNGFRRYHQVNAGVSVNTQLFGMWQRDKGWLRGVRHVMKPSVSMNYSPNNQNPNLGYFDALEYLDINGDTIRQEYSIFENGIYGAPQNRGTTASIGYSITNNFEAKYFSKKDSTEHKFSLFDNVTVRGSYNYAADSLKFSTVQINGTTRLFKRITTFNFNARFDPYNLDEDGRRIESFYWTTDRKPLRFEEATARLNSSIRVAQIRDLIANGFGDSNDSGESQEAKKSSSNDLISLFERFTINHVFAVKWDVIDQRDTFFVQTHTVNMRGNIDLTDKWSVTVGNIGYDFKAMRLSYPDFGLSRSLHCWQMGINVQPSFGTYRFYIRVNPGSSMSFLNVPWTKNRADRGNKFLE